jgi:hypothetical protein
MRSSHVSVCRCARSRTEMTRNFHPEFGCFSPVPRFRRDLRLAFGAFASGAALGAVTIVAVYVNYREPDASAGVVNSAIITRHLNVNGTADNPKLELNVANSRPEATASHKHQYETSGTTPAAAATKPFSRLRSETFTGVKTEGAVPMQPLPRVAEESTHLMHEQRSDARARPVARAEESAPKETGSADARSHTRARTVFWDWSR